MEGFLESILRSHDIEILADADGLHHAPDRRESLLWEDPAGPLTIYRGAASGRHFYCLRLGNDVAVDVMRVNQLAVLPGPEAPQVTIDHFLADQVFPRAISLQGELVLHAGAIRDERRGLLLLGPSGSGKSTLVASFLQSGWTLMGDDAVIFASDGGIPTATAVYPSLRLFPESIDALFPESVVSHDMAHYSPKQRIDLSMAKDCRAPAVVSAIFVLAGEGHTAVHRLSVAEACMAIVENSFALDPTDRDRASERLQQASSLAGTIPAFSLTYPRDYGRLPEVREALLSKLDDAMASAA